MGIMLIVSLVACKEKDYKKMLMEQQKVRDSINSTIEGKAAKIPSNNFEIINFEGCEYIIYKEEPDHNSAFGFMAHKGNCSNPIHKGLENRQ